MDAILLWNDVALEANRVSHTNGLKEQTGPTLSSRALAIVHLAMYDAYAGVQNDPVNLPLYLPGPALPASGGAQEVDRVTRAKTIGVRRRCAGPPHFQWCIPSVDDQPRALISCRST